MKMIATDMFTEGTIRFISLQNTSYSENALQICSPGVGYDTNLNRSQQSVPNKHSPSHQLF
jgi:hypothetical protein